MATEVVRAPRQSSTNKMSTQRERQGHPSKSTSGHRDAANEFLQDPLPKLPYLHQRKLHIMYMAPSRMRSGSEALQAR